MRCFKIEKPDESLRDAIKDKIDNLNKPKGSLGLLETLAEQICLIQQTLTPTLQHPCHLLFGGDHGIEREGVSVSPRDVTWQQMINFTRGGGGVNMFCRQHGFTLYIIDMGVDHDLTAYTDILNRKIAHGTKNFLYEPAMTEAQFNQAIETGCELVDRCHQDGCNIICMGEMGIANTSPSSIWMHLFGNIPLDECIGAGAGLNNPGLQHKREVLHKAVAHYIAHSDKENKLEPLLYFAGFEMAGAIGAMLRAAELKMTVMVDGFIMSACMLAASQLYPEVLHYAVFGHCGDEGGHRRMLDPIIESAVRMVNEMNNFKNAHITKYF